MKMVTKMIGALKMKLKSICMETMFKLIIATKNKVAISAGITGDYLKENVIIYLILPRSQETKGTSKNLLHNITVQMYLIFNF